MTSDTEDVIDLDAGRVARNVKPIRARLNGEMFELPGELPLLGKDVVDAAKAEKWNDSRFIPAFVKALMTEADWKRLQAAGAGYPDLVYLYDQALQRYGVASGESSPSASSSKKPEGSSKPSSTGSTDSGRQRASSKATTRRRS